RDRANGLELVEDVFDGQREPGSGGLRYERIGRRGSGFSARFRAGHRRIRRRWWRERGGRRGFRWPLSIRKDLRQHVVIANKPQGEVARLQYRDDFIEACATECRSAQDS